MAVTVSNLIQGPGTLYQGAFGATEPSDTLVNAVPATSAWTDLGGTDGGATLTFAQEWSKLTVDQLIEPVGRRLVSREGMIKTNLAEPTLENLAFATNNTAPVSGSGYKSLDLDAADSSTQPNYKAHILDGYAPGATQKRRRVIFRRSLNSSNVEMAYQKENKTLIPVEFACHYVSNVIKSVHIVDET